MTEREAEHDRCPHGRRKRTRAKFAHYCGYCQSEYQASYYQTVTARKRAGKRGTDERT
jgi:hypothetical protein